MPSRSVPLVTGEIYHVFNRGLDGRDIFVDEREFRRMEVSMWFYLHSTTPMRISYYLGLSSIFQQKQIERLRNMERGVEILAYCLMKNHFHLLVRQLVDEGLTRYMATLQNSYTRYFNTRNKRKGALLETQFKAVHVEDESQLLHVSRYIHLNPFTGGLVDTVEELENYPWSSLPIYLGKQPDSRRMVATQDILSAFDSGGGYGEFVLERAEYQRELGKVKRLMIDME